MPPRRRERAPGRGGAGRGGAGRGGAGRGTRSPIPGRSGNHQCAGGMRIPAPRPAAVPGATEVTPPADEPGRLPLGGWRGRSPLEALGIGARHGRGRCAPGPGRSVVQGSTISVAVLMGTSSGDPSGSATSEPAGRSARSGQGSTRSASRARTAWRSMSLEVGVAPVPSAPRSRLGGTSSLSLAQGSTTSPSVSPGVGLGGVGSPRPAGSPAVTARPAGHGSTMSFGCARAGIAPRPPMRISETMDDPQLPEHPICSVYHLLARGGTLPACLAFRDSRGQRACPGRLSGAGRAV